MALRDIEAKQAADAKKFAFAKRTHEATRPRGGALPGSRIDPEGAEQGGRVDDR